ncbi:hypothetical protein QYM36_003839 [Artemia franciscana]|uniref:LIM zinc-binding domain-containing protein n=1 Tax=Artemia franciscana TaxID=6661 RepID=A0AA88I564_ARTSF|nr:hypothetical protein QYM36_003839 [Artemia franciscana]
MAQTFSTMFSCDMEQLRGGNKGGVGVRFELHNTSVCIVNCHLAAHIEEIERRFQDYHDICERMSFPPAKTIKDHNLVFWFGDLNYRLTGIEGQAAKDLIDTANYEQLFMFDQLREQKRIKRVFDGYQEGIPNFRPTYKYDTGTDNWDSSKKNRAPAWTDRILWKADGVDQIVYRSHPSLKISDHKPVSSLFEIPIAVICSVEVATISNTGQTNERAIAKNLINKFERWEAEDEKENRPNQRQSHLSLYEEEGIEHSLESTRDFKARFEAWNNQRTTPVNEQKSRTKTNERAIAKNLINKFERWEAEDEKENRPNQLENENRLNQRLSHLSLYEEEGIEHSLESTRDIKARFEAWNNQRTTPVNEQKSRTKEIQPSVTIDVCCACNQKVYAMERHEGSGRLYHKNCFKCSQCSCILRLDSFSFNAGKLYCIVHYTQNFKVKGNYEEGFGTEPTSKTT